MRRYWGCYKKWTPSGSFEGEPELLPIDWIEGDEAYGGLGLLFHPDERLHPPTPWAPAPCYTIAGTRVAEETAARGASDLLKATLAALSRLTELGTQVLAVAASDIHADTCLGSALPGEKRHAYVEYQKRFASWAEGVARGPRAGEFDGRVWCMPGFRLKAHPVVFVWLVDKREVDLRACQRLGITPVRMKAAEDIGYHLLERRMSVDQLFCYTTDAAFWAEDGGLNMLNWQLTRGLLRAGRLSDVPTGSHGMVSKAFVQGRWVPWVVVTNGFRDIPWLNRTSTPMHFRNMIYEAGRKMNELVVMVWNCLRSCYPTGKLKKWHDPLQELGWRSRRALESLQRELKKPLSSIIEMLLTEPGQMTPQRAAVLREMARYPDLDQAIAFFDDNLVPSMACTAVILDPLVGSVLRKCLIHELIQVFHVKGAEQAKEFVKECPDLYCCTAIALAQIEI